MELIEVVLNSTKQNTSTSEQEKKTISTPKSSNDKSQSNLFSFSSSNSNNLDSNHNSSSNISPIGISTLKPIKHYKNVSALKKYKASRICDTDRRLLS